MADVTLTYKGSDILELSNSGGATLKTGGKYCEDDIAVEYVKPSGGGGSTELPYTDVTTTVEYKKVQDLRSALHSLTGYSAIWVENLTEMPTSGYYLFGGVRTATGHLDAVYRRTSAGATSQAGWSANATIPVGSTFRVYDISSLPEP